MITPWFRRTKRSRHHLCTAIKYSPPQQIEDVIALTDTFPRELSLSERYYIDESGRWRIETLTNLYAGKFGTIAKWRSVVDECVPIIPSQYFMIPGWQNGFQCLRHSTAVGKTSKHPLSNERCGMKAVSAYKVEPGRLRVFVTARGSY